MNSNHKLSISNGMKRFFINGGKNGMFGKHTSNYQKKIVSNTHKGIPLSLEHRKKISLSKNGIKFTDSHKKNLSIAHKKNRKRLFTGTNSSYKCLHVWLKRNLPKLECEQCHSTDRLQYANRTGLYKKDISDYIILCTLCHVRYDWKMHREKLKNEQ